MMRIPGSSEKSAFSILLMFVLWSFVAVVLGVGIESWVGFVVFGVGAVAAVVFLLVSKEPEPRRPLAVAAQSPHPHGGNGPGSRHVLVVANETLTGTPLRDEIARRGGTSFQLDILAPVLTSRAHHLMSDYDAEAREAHRRLDASLAWAASQGFEARGEVGDSDPLTGLEDELRDFGADEVIVVTHPRKQANWAESGELERLRRELEVPVTHVVVDREHNRGKVES
jgi:hypothetical protein